MEAKRQVNAQKLSPIAVVQLMQSLLCFQGYVSAGSGICNQARDKFSLPHVGRGDETIAVVETGEKFARVCNTCPVLLTALSNLH